MSARAVPYTLILATGLPRAKGLGPFLPSEWNGALRQRITVAIALDQDNGPSSENGSADNGEDDGPPTDNCSPAHGGAKDDSGPPAANDENDDDGADDQDAEAQGHVPSVQVLGSYDPVLGWSKTLGVILAETTTPGRTALRVGQTGNQVVAAIRYKPHEIAESGLKLGNHASLDGEYVGGTFCTNNFEVIRRCYQWTRLLPLAPAARGLAVGLLETLAI